MHLGHCANEIVQLDSPMLVLISDVAEDKQEMTFPPMSFFLNDIVNIGSSHGNYRVLIAETEDAYPFQLLHPRFIVWLFSWNGTTFESSGTIDLEKPITDSVERVGSQRTFSTLKLMYHVLSPSDDLQQWLGQPLEKADVLYYPKSMIEDVLADLQLWHDKETNEKTFLKWQVATVPRNAFL